MTPFDGIAAPKHTTMTAMPAGGGMTIVDLSSNPDDFRPAIDAVKVRLRDAMAANERVILMLGEEHDCVAHVRFAEMVRTAIEKDEALNAYYGRPVMAMEHYYNLFQHYFSFLFPETINRFNTAAYEGLRTKNAAEYHHLNALTCAAFDEWTLAPVTKLENLLAWQHAGLDIRMVDVATYMGFDLSDPEINRWVKTLTPKFQRQLKYFTTIDLKAPLGMQLRNLFMADQLRQIDSPLIILQTGFTHLGGNEAEGDLFQNSLHALLKPLGTSVIGVYQELVGFGINFNDVSEDGQRAINNPDTIVIKNVSEMGHRHRQDYYSKSEDEISALHAFAKYAGTPPVITDEADYHRRREEFRQTLLQEAIKLGVIEVAPAPQAEPSAAPSPCQG